MGLGRANQVVDPASVRRVSNEQMEMGPHQRVGVHLQVAATYAAREEREEVNLVPYFLGPGEDARK